MPKKKPLDLSDVAPRIRESALAFARGDRSRIVVESRSRVSVVLDAKKPRPSEEDRGS